MSPAAWRPPTDEERAIAEHFAGDLRKLPEPLQDFGRSVRQFVTEQARTTDKISGSMCRIITRSMYDRFPPAVVELARLELERITGQGSLL